MGTAKVLGGLVFLVLGIVLLIISFVPIPGMEVVSFTSQLITYITNLQASMASMDIAAMIGPSGYLYIAAIIPWVGYIYCRAGIKSMRYDKKKKSYYVSETKIGLLITGFILICLAAVFILMIFIDIFDPAFQFIVDLVPTFSYPGLLPQLLIPIVLTLLIVFFIYWIGSKIMKSGVKKEELF